jgi:hypothetical protein
MSDLAWQLDFKCLHLENPSNMVCSIVEGDIWSISKGKGRRDSLHALAGLCRRQQGVNYPQKGKEIHKSTPQAPPLTVQISWQLEPQKELQRQDARMERIVHYQFKHRL